MVTPSRGRAAFSDITNSNNTALPPTPCDEVKRKREEKNRKQREYRARKKAEANNPYTGTFNHEANNPYTAGSINESIVISATPTQPTPISISQRRKSVRDKDRRGELSEEQRKEMNRKQREYRARKKAAPYNLYRGSAGTYSAIGQHSPYGTAYSTILQALGSSNPATPTVGYSSCNRSHGVPSDSKGTM